MRRALARETSKQRRAVVTRYFRTRDQTGRIPRREKFTRFIVPRTEAEFFEAVRAIRFNRGECLLAQGLRIGLPEAPLVQKRLDGRGGLGLFDNVFVDMTPWPDEVFGGFYAPQFKA